MDFLDFGVDLGAIDGSKFYCQFIAGKMMMMNCCFGVMYSRYLATVHDFVMPVS